MVDIPSQKHIEEQLLASIEKQRRVQEIAHKLKLADAAATGESTDIITTNQ